MSTEKEVVREHLKAYYKASRAEKIVIIDNVAKVLKQHRKTIIRSFKREQMISHYKKRAQPSVND